MKEEKFVYFCRLRIIIFDDVFTGIESNECDGRYESETNTRFEPRGISSYFIAATSFVLTYFNKNTSLRRRKKNDSKNIYRHKIISIPLCIYDTSVRQSVLFIHLFINEFFCCFIYFVSWFAHLHLT